MGKLCGVPEQEAAWLGPDSAPDVQCDHVTASLGAWFPVQTKRSFRQLRQWGPVGSPPGGSAGVQQEAGSTYTWMTGGVGGCGEL